MKKNLYILSMILILISGMSSCTSAGTSTPVSTTPNLSYTAAAETIVAQLTGLSLPSTPVSTSLPAPTLPITSTIPSLSSTLIPVTETLPATSTPLPTKTPILTDTPTATHLPNITPSSTSTDIDPRNRLGEPTWQDKFIGSSNWPLFSDRNITMEIANNRLMMTALQAGSWESWMVSTPILKNFYLEVTAKPGDCGVMDRYGLLARATADAKNAYLFGFTCDGKYSFRIWNGSRFIMLIEWSPSQFINPWTNQINRLGFLAEGTKFTLFANGNMLATIEDDSFGEGAFGLFIGAVTTDEFTVEFSEVSYWELP